MESELYPDEEQRRRIMDFIMAAGQTLLENGGEVLPAASSPSPSPSGTPLPKGEARRCGQALGSPFGRAGKAAGFD